MKAPLTPEELEARRQARNARKREARAAKTGRDPRGPRLPKFIAPKAKEPRPRVDPVIAEYHRALEACAENKPLRAELRETILAHGMGTMSSAAAIQTMQTIASVAMSTR